MTSSRVDNAYLLTRILAYSTELQGPVCCTTNKTTTDLCIPLTQLRISLNSLVMDRQCVFRELGKEFLSIIILL
jgi:hypothetical protein